MTSYSLVYDNNLNIPKFISLEDQPDYDEFLLEFGSITPEFNTEKKRPEASYLRYNTSNTSILDVIVSNCDPGEVIIYQGKYISIYALEVDRVYWLGHNMDTQTIHWYADGTVTQEEKDSLLHWDIIVREPSDIELDNFRYIYPYATDKDNCIKVTPDSIIYFHPAHGFYMDKHMNAGKSFGILSYSRCHWRLDKKFLMFIPREDHVSFSISSCIGPTLENWPHDDSLTYTNNGIKYELVMVKNETTQYLTLKRSNWNWDEYEPVPSVALIFWNTWYRRLIAPRHRYKFEDFIQKCPLCGYYVHNSTIDFWFYVNPSGIVIGYANWFLSNYLVEFVKRPDGYYFVTQNEKEYRIMRHIRTAVIDIIPVHDLTYREMIYTDYECSINMFI